MPYSHQSVINLLVAETKLGSASNSVLQAELQEAEAERKRAEELKREGSAMTAWWVCFLVYHINKFSNK
jgi:hypothetical protein